MVEALCFQLRICLALRRHAFARTGRNDDMYTTHSFVRSQQSGIVLAIKEFLVEQTPSLTLFRSHKLD